MAVYTLEEIAKMTFSQLEGDPLHQIKGVEDLETAGPEEASFLANLRYVKSMQESSAGAIFISPDIPRPTGKNFLLNTDPSRAFQKLVELFSPSAERESGFNGIHPTAIIHPLAEIAEEVSIAPNVVIDQGVKIAKGTSIGANVSIGPFTVIGENCIIYPNVCIRERCILGNRVIIQPGVVIGSCGFGYTTDQKGHHSSLKQIGNVVLEDDVEIGANTSIDRARFKSTRIRKGSKIDNLVQIAHGVEVGEHNLIVSQVGIAGSSKTGRNVVLAGQSALVGHITLADGVILAARGAASKSLPPGVYHGAPAIPIKEHNEQMVYVRNLKKYVKRIEQLEKKIASLEESEKVTKDCCFTSEK